MKSNFHNKNFALSLAFNEARKQFGTEMAYCTKGVIITTLWQRIRTQRICIASLISVGLLLLLIFACRIFFFFNFSPVGILMNNEITQYRRPPVKG